MIGPSQLHRIRIELVNIACIKECFRAWNRRRRPVPRHFPGLWLSRRSLGGLPRRLPACSAFPDVPKLHTSLAFLTQVIAHHMLLDLLIGRGIFRLHKEEGAGPLGGAPKVRVFLYGRGADGWDGPSDAKGSLSRSPGCSGPGRVARLPSVDGMMPAG